MGNLESSSGCYQVAIAVYRNSSGTSVGDLANAIRGFAVMKDTIGSKDEAQTLWEEARNLYASLGVDEGVEECEERLKS